MTRKQWTVVQHCQEFTFVHQSDIDSGKFSRELINRLVRRGVLDFHPAMHGDENMWDLSNAAYTALRYDKFTRRQLVAKSMVS